jgi:hypothetical protein
MKKYQKLLFEGNISTFFMHLKSWESHQARDQTRRAESDLAEKTKDIPLEGKNQKIIMPLPSLKGNQPTNEPILTLGLQRRKTWQASLTL